MSGINNSKSLFKSNDVLNYETITLSSIKTKTKTRNSQKYETLDHPTSAIDYYSFSSDTSEVYFTDSEGSKLLIIPKKKKYIHSSPTSDLDTDYCKVTNNLPLATSSPLHNNNNNINHKDYSKKTYKKVSNKHKLSNNNIKLKPSKVNKCHKNSDKTISLNTVCSTGTPNLLNETTLMKYKSQYLISQNQEKKQDHTTFNSRKQVSQKKMNEVTNILYTNESQITSQKPSCSINKSLSSENKSNAFQLNFLSNQTVNTIQNRKYSSCNKIDVNKTFNKNTSIIFKNLQMIDNTKNTKFDDSYLNDDDLSDIFQMELSLKMFSGSIVPYLNSMKHEILHIINKYMYKLDKQFIERFKHVNDIIKNIHNVMKLRIHNSTDLLLNNKKYSTIPFIDVDLNNLNLLKNKLEYVKKLEPVKFTLFNNILFDQKDKSIKKISVENKFLEFNSSKNLKSFKSATDNNNDVIALTNTAALDSFNCIRDLNKSNPLLFSVNDCIDINESSKRQFLENCSLISINELPRYEISENVTQDINYSYNELHIDKFVPTNKTFSSNFEVANNNDIPVKINENRYWLRNNRKTTKQFIAPFKRTSKKLSKKTSIKSNYNDIFVCKGTGKKKVILQYKINSILKANSDDLMKKMCPEIKNKKFNNDKQNTTVFDVSNLKPKKVEKPCQCGIFPSQVPSFWTDSMHKSLHRNLHKLQFKSQIPVYIANKINDNGLLFNIIKVTNNCDDINLRFTLKNIKHFINLEIDFSKKSINNNVNHSIFLAVNPEFKIIGYLEIEPLTNACIYQNNQLSKKLIAVKFGVSKVWVMVKYRNNGVATKLLKQFCDEEHLKTNDIAFSFHGNHGISFIKKYFGNNSVLIY